MGGNLHSCESRRTGRLRGKKLGKQPGELPTCAIVGSFEIVDCQREDQFEASNRHKFVWPIHG
jgi:hypothetical protein